MKFRAEAFTTEDFLRAKKVCDGTSTDIAFFNKCFTDLREYISEKFSIREDPSENPLDKEHGTEIHRDFKIMMYVDRVMTELSIGEFILKSLQDWDPDSASYLTYIYDLLVNWNARVPVTRTENQQVQMYQLKALIDVVKSVNPELEMKDLPFDELLQKLGQYLPEEYKRKLLKILPVFQSASSLDVGLSKDWDSDTFLDMVESTYSSDEEIPVLKKDPVAIIEKAYNQFKNAKLQKRTATRISLYTTVQLIESTTGYLSFSDFRELASKYPGFIVDMDWIEQVFMKNTEEHPDYQLSTRLPSQIQQAEHLGIDYHSYCNSILSYKKKIRNLPSP